MNNKLSKIKRIAIFLSGVSAISIPATASADWSIIRLGTLGGYSSQASDINNFGQVVGSSNIAAENTTTHAFITGRNGVGMTDLGTLGGSLSDAAGINNYGQVVGYSLTAGNNAVHAFVTGRNGVGMTDLGTLGGGAYSVATDINDSGQVVGYSDGQAFITHPNSVVMAMVDMLPVSNYSDAVSINKLGQVAGMAQFPGDSFKHAYITGPDNAVSTVSNLGTLHGYSGSYAIDMNDRGQVVGESYAIERGSYYSHIFITGPNGVGMSDLGTLGGQDSFVTGINNRGQVVGGSLIDNDNPLYHGFLYTDGGMIDLSLLDVVVAAGWTQFQPTAINDNGQITGNGQLASDPGHSQAFLLSFSQDTVFTPNPIFIPPIPVPEPQTYAMLLAGLGLLGFMARRRKKSAVYVIPIHDRYGNI